MDQLFKEKLQEKQRHFTNAANETEDQFAERHRNVNNTMNTNIDAMQKMVDQKVYDGMVLHKAQTEELDYSHDYILRGIKKDIKANNSKVYNNIKKYGKAEPTEADIRAKSGFKGILSDFVNKIVDKAKDKDGNIEEGLLSLAKQSNEHADLSTAIEMDRLSAYSVSFEEYFKRENGSVFKKLAQERMKGVKEADKKNIENQLYTDYVYTVLPFIKTYKKGWFGRRYTLDGNRMQFKDGESKPEDFNKELLESLMLETDAKKLSGKKLKENRKKKAVILQRLTTELIEYGEKFDPKKMTDAYVTRHIVELQEYYARLNAFKGLVSRNTWFFFGKDIKEQNARKAIVSDAVDPEFVNLVKTRILDMAAPVSNFLESHLSAHCIKSSANFPGRKFGMRRLNDAMDKKRVVVVGTDDDEVVEGIEDASLNELAEICANLTDLKEQPYRFQVFAHSYEIVNTTADTAHDGMSEQDKQEYAERLQWERNQLQTGVTNQLLTNRILKNKRERIRPLSRDINLVIKKEMDAVKKQAENRTKAYNEQNADKIKTIPYLDVTTGDDGAFLLQQIDKKLHSENGNAMYMFYGPELDHIYGRMYAAVRLRSEMFARKSAIGKQFKFDRIRAIEKDLKNRRLPKPTRREREAELARIRTANRQAVAFQCKNEYAKFASEILIKDRLARAEQEYDEMNKKIEYVKEQLRICNLAMNFFLRGAGEPMIPDKDYAVVRRFLDKEHLGYMLDAYKIDNYDKWLDEALTETEKEFEKEAGKDAAGLKYRKVRGVRDKAGRIHQVRRRAMLATETKKAHNEFLTKPHSDAEAFEQLILMPPERLSDFNIKGSLPMNTPEQKKKSMDLLLISNMAAGKTGAFDPKYYTDRPKMLMLFERLKKEKKISERASFVRFMADIEIKITLIRKWNNYFTSTFKNQKDDKYFYLDTDTLNGLSLNKLGKLREKLKEKARDLHDRAEAAKGDKNAKSHPPIYYYRLERAKQCDELVTMVENRMLEIPSQEDFTDLTVEAYNHKLNAKIRDLEIDIAKDDFVFADSVHIMLKHLSEEHKAEYEAKWENTLDDKVKKDKDFITDEKKLMKEVMALTVRLREIPVNMQLIELVNKAMKGANYLAKDEMHLLIGYGRTLADVGRLFREDASWGGNPNVIALRKYIEKKENKELYAEIKARYDVLEPLYTAVEKHLAANGFIGCYHMMVSLTYSRENVPEDQEVEKSVEIDQLGADRNKAIEKLKKNLESTQEIFAESNTTKLFKLVYDAGEKLSIGKIEDWKKIFKTISQKGYYKKKSGSKEDQSWMKATADYVLSRWPHSFEDFYAEYAKLSTGKALDETFRKIAKDNKTAFVEDTGHAAEISAVISKSNTMIYNGLSLDKRRALDEALKHANYDPKVFKYLFKDVEVNGVGMPVGGESVYARQYNESLASLFIHRNDKEEHEEGKAARNWSSKDEWNGKVIVLFKSALRFKITPEMTKPEYIKKNFAYLYRQTRQFAALKAIYDHEKDILNDPKTLKENYVSTRTVNEIHNAFGPKTRSVYAMYFDMIEAYAKMYFVDEEGHFDTGLEPEELGLDGRELTEEQKEQNKLRINETLIERENRYKRIATRVNAELDRAVLAQKVNQSNEVGQTLNAIHVKGDQQVFRMVQNDRFSGDLGDMNNLLQSKKLAQLVKNHNGLLEKMKEVNARMEPLFEEVEKAKATGDQQKRMAVMENIGYLELELSKLKVEIGNSEYEIKEYQRVNRNVFERYNESHDAKGNLKTIEAIDKNTNAEYIGKYIEYQNLVYRDVKRIYDDFKQRLVSAKKNNTSMFTADYIITKFKQDEMIDWLQELKKLDLYLGLLEVDKERFKTGNYDVMKKYKDYTEGMKKRLKKMPEETHEQRVMKRELQAEIKDMNGSYAFINEVLADMKSKENPVQLVHDFVRLINLTLKSYGVAADGQVTEEKVKAEADGKLTEQEIRNIAYDEADKIGDAHIQLQREVNQRLGFEKVRETGAKPKQRKDSKKSGKKDKNQKEINITLESLDNVAVEDLK